MIDRLLDRVHDTKHAAPVLRGYLWWGLLLRVVLLLGLGTLLVVEGNVLAEWLMTVRPPTLPQEDLEELTTVSYTVVVLLLMIGAGARWHLLRRLDAPELSPDASPVPTERMQDADD